MDIHKFTELYRTVYKDLYRYALCMMRQPQDAEDAVSEAVVSAYEHIHSLRKEEAFRSWIFQITANVCKRKLKETSRQDVEIPETQPFYDVDKELNMDLQRALIVLDEDERNIISLSAFYGYNSVEIGKILKMNPNTVRSKRKRAVEKLGVSIRC